MKDRAKTAHYPMNEYDRVMNINARGVAMCMAAEARVMLGQSRKLTSNYWKDSRRGQVGAIVNFASVCGFIAFPNVMPYNASKHAVSESLSPHAPNVLVIAVILSLVQQRLLTRLSVGMTRSAAIEYAEAGLRINAVCPGIVDTPFLDGVRSTGVDESSPFFKNPLGRLCYPDEIADSCVFLSSTMSSYINGIALVSDGGKTVQYF